MVLNKVVHVHVEGTVCRDSILRIVPSDVYTPVCTREEIMTITLIITEDTTNTGSQDGMSTDTTVLVVINGPADVTGTTVQGEDVCLSSSDIFNPYAGTREWSLAACITDTPYTVLLPGIGVPTTAPVANALPATGSSSPIIGLIGILFVAVGMFFRRMAK